MRTEILIMQRLMNIANEVQKVSKRVRPVGVALALVSEDPGESADRPHDVLALGFVLRCRAVIPEVVVDVVPGRVVIFGAVVAAYPVAPGSRAQEHPFVFGEPLRPLGGQELLVVRLLAQNGHDLGPLLFGELVLRPAADDHVAFVVPA